MGDDDFRLIVPIDKLNDDLSFNAEKKDGVLPKPMNKPIFRVAIFVGSAHLRCHGCRQGGRIEFEIPRLVRMLTRVFVRLYPCLAKTTGPVDQRVQRR